MYMNSSLQKIKYHDTSHPVHNDFDLKVLKSKRQVLHNDLSQVPDALPQ